MTYKTIILALGYTVLALVGAYIPFLLLTSARLIPTVILLFIYGAYFLKFSGKADWPIRKLWITFWLTLLVVRVDVSFIDKPGPPRLVPCRLLYLSDETREQVRQGEVIWLDGTTFLVEPLWLIVW